ncbi:hypothetical protein V6N12_052195 [Hibiscus sabdariffa]|uniref:Uncharacterized protein n=1 Tax=Hibiscus sabdariffa TaxID=183260 RepID=A0ABR2GIR2_9ROSI
MAGLQLGASSPPSSDHSSEDALNLRLWQMAIAAVAHIYLPSLWSITIFSRFPRTAVKVEQSNEDKPPVVHDCV